MILKVENLKKQFGNFIAVNNISFEMKSGDRIGIIGPNGSGKTTMVEMLAGVSQPTKGKIKYGFQDTDSPKEFIGIQFQNSNYPSGLTVKDIIAFGRNIRKLKDISNDELKKMLKVFRMENIYKKKIRSLSGGEKQRINILLSIIHNPKIVILDEISTGLDIASREDIISFTDKLLEERKMSLLLISHHMEEIRALCKKVIFIYEGKIQEHDSIKNIEKKYGSLETCATRTLFEETNASNV